MAKKPTNYRPKERTRNQDFVLYDAGTHTYMNTQLKPVPFEDDLLVSCPSEADAEIIAKILNKKSFVPVITSVKQLMAIRDTTDNADVKAVCQECLDIYK